MNENIKIPTKTEIQKVKHIITKLQEYAINNNCYFELLHKTEENETEISFSESGFNLEFVVSWSRNSELENIEIYDSESKRRETISFSSFIKFQMVFLK